MVNLFVDANAAKTKSPKIVAAMSVSEAAEAVEMGLVDYAGTKQRKAKPRHRCGPYFGALDATLVD